MSPIIPAPGLAPMSRKLLAALVGSICLALFLWAFWIEPDSLRVQTYDLPLKRWPAEQTGLRVAVLADIHAGAPWIDDAKLQKICELVEAAHPDLILSVGDMLMGQNFLGHEVTPEHVANRLDCLKAPLGHYAVLGNNDYAYGETRMRNALHAHGIEVIDNQIARIAKGPHQFWLAGFKDAAHGHDQVLPIVDQIHDDAPIIGLTHEPVIFYMMSPRINLVVAGHTHGGQVRIPFFGRPALTYLQMNDYEAGHYLQQTDLFVSTGIGTNNLAVRFGVPPEISLLVLKPSR